MTIKDRFIEWISHRSGFYGDSRLVNSPGGVLNDFEVFTSKEMLKAYKAGFNAGKREGQLLERSKPR